MENFKLYLHYIDDGLKVSTVSRWGKDNLTDEWRAAQEDYVRHVFSAKDWLSKDVLDYALASWPQQLNSLTCLRKQPIVELKCSAEDSTACLTVENEDLGTRFSFLYEDVLEFDWKRAVTGMALIRTKGRLVFNLDEIRFPSEGIVEHEFHLLDGGRLTVVARKLTLSQDQYLGKWLSEPMAVQVKQFVLHEWDPAGIAQSPHLQSIYDIGVVDLAILMSVDAPKKRLAEELSLIAWSSKARKRYDQLQVRPEYNHHASIEDFLVVADKLLSFVGKG